MGWGAAVRIELNDAERSELQARARRRKIARADAMRAEIVLLAADGMSNLAIAQRLGITRVTVATWRKRFAAKRLDGLVDEPRPGAPRKIGDDKIAEVVTTTLEKLPTAATHWSTRSMAKASGLAPSTVHRWLADGFIAGEQVTPGSPWRIRVTDELRGRFVEQAPEGWLPMLEATMALGVSRQTVLQRVKRGELRAVHVRTGRRKGLRIEVAKADGGLFDALRNSEGVV